MKPEDLLLILLEAADQVRVFHWQTKSYAEHKALGKLYDGLSASTDAIAETLMGALDERPKLGGELKLVDYSEGAPAAYVKQLSKTLSELKDMPTDVLNERDTLLSLTHTTSYLLTLK